MITAARALWSGNHKDLNRIVARHTALAAFFSTVDGNSVLKDLGGFADAHSTAKAAALREKT